MSIIAKKSDSENNIKIIPAGTYQGVCYAVHDIGNQKVVWQNQEKIKHQVIIAFEIDKLIETDGEYKGKRYVLSKKYTLSLSEKANLRKDLESWSGQSMKAYEKSGYDLEKLIGKNCMLSVVHTNASNGNTYANIGAIMGCPKGVQTMTPENDGSPPEWVQKLQAQAIAEEDRPKTDKEIQDAFGEANAQSEDFPELNPDEVPFG